MGTEQPEATIDFQAVEETIKAGYRQVTYQYRQDDEIEVRTEHHRRVSAILQHICTSFPHPIAALEVGCGTGRYFHCLTNVSELTGIDITEEMLEAARHPVRQSEVSVPSIRLIRANIYGASFPSGSFHFIYSLGMFGNGCPVTVELCDRFYDWLAPGGKLFFNTVDIAGLPLQWRLRRRTRRLLYPMLPRNWQDRLEQRSARNPFFGLDQTGLQQILKRSRFSDFKVESHVCQSPLWSGRHLECLASKSS